MACRRVGRDDRGRLREAVALIHRDADGVVVSLEVDVEECSSADEEFHVAAESLAYCLEDDLVEKKHQRLAEDVDELGALVVAFLVVCDGVLEGEVVEFLDCRAFLGDRGLDALLEVLCEGRH